MNYQAPRNYPAHKEQVSLREIRKDYYKIRKFEIQNLWQRSVFLATFIVILFTGYGTLVEKLLSLDGSKAIIAHIICCFLALIGSIFSMIWIMMAKGSKAWFEIYERKIIDGIETEKKLNIPKKYRMRKGAPWKLDNSLWTRKPGAYSVSKINILLGQVLWGIWILIFVLHSILLVFIISPENNLYILIATIYIALFMMGFTIIKLPNILLTWTKSEAIKDPEEQSEEEGEE